MTTTDIDALQSRIARVLAIQDGFGPEHPDHEVVTGEWFSVADAVLPIVEAEVRAAKAEALREAADHIEEVVINARPARAFTEHVLMEHGGPGYLRELATDYETGDGDEHR